MTRLIDAEALKKAINDYFENGVIHWLTDIERIIDNAPTVEPTFKPIAEISFSEDELKEIVDKAMEKFLSELEKEGEWLTEEAYSDLCLRASREMSQGEWIEIPVDLDILHPD